MRVAVVGPAYPAKGGVVLHTARLCGELKARGHDVALLPWTSPYPHRLYPGELEVPGGVPETGDVPRRGRDLRWWDPPGWWRAGRSARGADRLVLVHVVPQQAPALLTVSRGSAGVPATVIAHNVLPHEGHPGDRLLVRRLLDRAERVVVHTAAQRLTAQTLDPSAITVVAALPPHLPDGVRSQPLPAPSRCLRVLVPGTVRPYKGVDVLIAALAEAPDVHAVVAGEVWGEAADLRFAARRLGVEDRLEVRAGYVPAAKLGGLYSGCDIVVLPYRSGSASQNVVLAHAFGRAVVASAVGSFPEQVREGVDGLLVRPDDPAALAAALRRLGDRDLLERLTAGISPVDEGRAWDAYVAAVLGVSG